MPGQGAAIEWQTLREQLTLDPEDRLFIEFRIPLAARMAAR
jgi:hypothetical protein